MDDVKEMEESAIIDEMRKALTVLSDVDFADIRFEASCTSVIDFRDGTFREISFGMDMGFSVRVLREGVWGFATSNDISRLKDCVRDALSICNALRCMRVRVRGVNDVIADGVASAEIVNEHFILKPRKEPEDVDVSEKKDIVKSAYETAKEHSPLVKSVSVLYMDGYERKIYANTEGSCIISEMPSVFFRVRAFALKGGVMHEGRENTGAVAGFELIDEEDPDAIAVRAAEKAVRAIYAEMPPAGFMTVIMDNRLSGVFMHEALGHAAEADHVLRGESILRGKLNEQIAVESLTVADDPTIERSFGFYRYDDEGVRARRNDIIRNGMLVSFLHSRETAFRMNTSTTGNARASDYGDMPIVRMSNIVVEPRDWRFEEMIEDIKLGIYAKGMRGGEVDTVKGEFQFSAEEAFLIENGELTKRLRNVSLSGKTLDTLKNIDAIGNDWGKSIGFCGKDGQEVTVAEYSPHIRVKILVGGVQNQNHRSSHARL